MGRYIGIGIVYQIGITGNRDSLKREDFYKVYPPEWFDYTRFEQEGQICLAPELSGALIAALRHLVLEMCCLPGESDRANPSAETELEEYLKNSRVGELVSQVGKKQYYTFFDYEHPWGFQIGDRKIGIRNRYFMIYCSHCKFYPGETTTYHEVNRKLEGLFSYALGYTRLSYLVQSFVTL